MIWGCETSSQPVNKLRGVTRFECCIRKKLWKIVALYVCLKKNEWKWENGCHVKLSLLCVWWWQTVNPGSPLQDIGCEKRTVYQHQDIIRAVGELWWREHHGLGLFHCLRASTTCHYHQGNRIPKFTKISSRTMSGWLSGREKLGEAAGQWPELWQ